MPPTAVAPSPAEPLASPKHMEPPLDAARVKAFPQPQLQPLPDHAKGALDEFRTRMNSTFESDSGLRDTFEVMNGGYPDLTLMRFLRAREYDTQRAEKMLTECLRWRAKNDIDNILERPMLGEKYEKIRASQQYGMTGYDNQGRPVLCVRVGLSFMDPSCKLEEYMHSHIQHNEYRDRVLLPEASRRKGSFVTTSVKIYDMSGLKLSHLGRMQMHRAVASVDDLNYPEKSEVYYVVNAPTVFGACWKAVRPLLQERTKNKVRVLQGNGAEELLQEMDESVLPHFVRYSAREGLGSSRNLEALATDEAIQDPSVDCCSTAHPYHVSFQEYMLKLRERGKAMGLHKNMSQREVVFEPGSGRRGEESDIGVVLEEALSKVSVSKEGAT